jgi:hypothetical protein
MTQQKSTIGLRTEIALGIRCNEASTWSSESKIFSVAVKTEWFVMAVVI